MTLPPAGEQSLQARRVVQVGQSPSASISAHMISLALPAPAARRPCTRPEITATSSLIELDHPSIIEHVARGHGAEELDRADRQQRRPLAPVGEIMISQVPAWQSASSTNGAGIAQPVVACSQYSSLAT